MFHEPHNEISMGGGGEVYEYMFETLKDFGFFSPPACTLTACEESNCPLLAWHIWDTECHSSLKLFQAFHFIQRL